MPSSPFRAASASSPIELVPVDIHDKRTKEAFIRLPWRIYDRNSHWCPPLLIDRRHFLDPAKNPFFDSSPVQLYMARRSGEWVGRIAVVENKPSNTFWKECVAHFGLFECIDDAEVGAALFDAAAQWAREHSLTVLRGPASFTSNHEFGMLISGFDQPPSVQMPYNPPYYPCLMDTLGFDKVKDLHMWWVGVTTEAPSFARVEHLATRVAERNRIRLRCVDMKRWDEELGAAYSIYRNAWKLNWGFSPVSEKEFRHLGNEMRPIVRPDVSLVAEVDGRPVAFSLTVLDANQAIRTANGRLFPFGLAKLLWGLRRVDALRQVLLGISDGYRNRGIDALLYVSMFKATRDAGRFRGAEVGWTLEDNHLINRGIEAMGGRRSKSYRIYERPLHPIAAVARGERIEPHLV